MFTLYNKATGGTDFCFSNKQLIETIGNTMGDDYRNEIQELFDYLAELESDIAELEKDYTELDDEYQEIRRKNSCMFTVEDVNKAIEKERQHVTTEWKNHYKALENKYKALEESRTIRVIKKGE